MNDNAHIVKNWVAMLNSIHRERRLERIWRWGGSSHGNAQDAAQGREADGKDLRG
jgi:hypothetical protein